MRDRSGKSRIVTAVSLCAVFVLFTALVMTVDVKEVGPMSSEVGFATVNSAFHELTGIHMGLYRLTEILGVLAIMVCLVFAAIGLRQLVQSRSIKGIDRDILILGGFYIAVICFYVLFEVIPVNYRPVIMDEGLEASYPSSHTMLIICVMSTAVMQIGRRVADNRLRGILISVSLLIILLTVVGRLLCGVHWLTDIVGGILLSVALVYIYYILCGRRT